MKQSTVQLLEAEMAEDARERDAEIEALKEKLRVVTEDNVRLRAELAEAQKWLVYVDKDMLSPPP